MSFSTDGGLTFAGSVPITCTEGPNGTTGYTGETYTFGRTTCNAVKMTLVAPLNYDNTGQKFGFTAINFLYQNALGS